MFARRFTVHHRHSPFAIAFGSPFAIRRSPSPSAFPTLPSPFTIHLCCSLFAVRSRVA
ncbi:hypothetical protein PAXINDRAFT_21699 [Paxillus involutus ATCC 200175]|uniref:Uncharacterized protein n=1 Tax=Paxillus involutus ATCC 200175 TaxID=664439 RepID=A0A0C9T9X3_PAXIN|nr:hypothetical protein PAXINDRAFT_21699 [Paxillus involutus ATCC 200175]